MIPLVPTLSGWHGGTCKCFAPLHEVCSRHTAAARQLQDRRCLRCQWPYRRSTQPRCVERVSSRGNTTSPQHVVLHGLFEAPAYVINPAPTPMSQNFNFHLLTFHVRGVHQTKKDKNQIGRMFLTNSRVRATKRGLRVPNPNSSGRATERGLRVPNPNSRDHATKHGLRVPRPNSRGHATKHGLRVPNPNSSGHATKRGLRVPNPNSRGHTD